MLAARGGNGVELLENLGGMLPRRVDCEHKLTSMVVPAESEEKRRCGQCRKDLSIRDFDQDRAGSLRVTCRICLVSHYSWKAIKPFCGSEADK